VAKPTAVEPGRRRLTAQPPPPLKRSQWPELCKHAKALNDGLLRTGLVSSEIYGTITSEEVEHLVDELDKTLELAVGEMDFVLGFMERLRVLAVQALSVQALAMLAFTPVLIAIMAGSCTWLLLRWTEPSLLRVVGDILLLIVSVVVGGGSGMAALAYHRLAPGTIERIRSDLPAVVVAMKRGGESQFEMVCEVVFSLALAYEVPDTRQKLCRIPWIAAAVLLVLELLISICSGSALTFAWVLLGCSAQALATGATSIAVAPRGSPLDCPPGATTAELVIARMGRSPLFVAAAAALAAGLGPAVESHLGLAHFNCWAVERLQNLRTVTKELQLLRLTVIKAARKTLASSNWSIAGTVGGLTAGVTSGVSAGVEGMSSGVSTIAKGASSLLFG